MTLESPVIAVLGASGLIGESLASTLRNDGFHVVPVARHFSAAQRALFGSSVVESPIVSLNTGELTQVINESKADIVVNCIGVLQDGSRGTTDEVHRNFVARLVDALDQQPTPILLLHISIPGREEEDQTSFSRSKRQAERIVTAGPIPYVVLRPGFVIAPAAYGGSALIRSLAAWPVNLPKNLTDADFAVTGICDIVKTIAFIAKRWQGGDRRWNAIWDVMEHDPSTVGSVLDAFRQHIGGPTWCLTLPSWLIALGAKAGDFVSHLAWASPIRSTAVLEMQRGVTGNPNAWVDETGIEPTTLGSALRALPATVQD